MRSVWMNEEWYETFYASEMAFPFLTNNPDLIFLQIGYSALISQEIKVYKVRFLTKLCYANV